MHVLKPLVKTCFKTPLGALALLAQVSSKLNPAKNFEEQELHHGGCGHREALKPTALGKK